MSRALREGRRRPKRRSRPRNTSQPAQPKDEGPILPHAILTKRFVNERLSLTEAELQSFFSLSELVTEGWVRQVQSRPDLRYWLAIEPREMGGMVDAARSLCESLSDEAPSFDSVRDAMLETLESVVGEHPPLSGENDETNIRRFLEKRLHVPVDQFSGLLDKDLDGFVAWYVKSAPAEREAFKADVCKKSALLDLARNHVRLSNDGADLKLDESSRTWRPKPGTAQEFVWIWGTEQGIRYYYIPLDYIL